MIKHGTSHGFSVLICTVLAAFLIEIFKPFLPKVYDAVDRASVWLIENFQVPVSVEYLSITLIASLLAILWGFFFKLRFSN